MISAISASFFGQLISAIQPLLLVPLFLRAWGGEGYGEWCILFAIVSYFSLLDFGSQNYIGNVLTENLIQKHKHNFQSNLSNAVSLFIIISGICFAFFIAIIYITTTFFSDLLPIKNQIENEQWILIFLGGSMLLSIPAGIYSTVYRAFNMVARVTIISNILRFFQLFIMAGALYMEYSPLAYAALYFLFSIIGVVVNIVEHTLEVVMQRLLVEVSMRLETRV
jgi:O-antigen/teichoic acid export membrane protein